MGSFLKETAAKAHEPRINPTPVKRFNLMPGGPFPIMTAWDNSIMPQLSR